MMLWQTILNLQLLILLYVPTFFSYPVYGTKRFGRTNVRRSNNLSWRTPLQNYQQPYLRTQRYPTNYYDMYPYSPDYTDDYYYRRDGLSYPLYMPVPRTSKYEVYQAVMPYYYDEKLISQPGYRYYGYNKDPEEELEDEIAQETEREEREEAQPIGQEVLYENDDENSRDSLDDANAVFLQNLILSQMYNGADPKTKPFHDNYGGVADYYDDQAEERWESPSRDQQKMDQEDKDVRELKQLVDSQYFPKRPTPEEREYWLQKQNHNNNKKQKVSNKTNHNLENKRDTSAVNKKDSNEQNRKSNVGVGSSTTEVPKKIPEPQYGKSKSGQKEEVLMRPATPVRHPFSDSLMAGMKTDPDRKREPSVYDTIKHMLDMERALENDKNAQVDQVRPPMRKRIVSSEDSLTRQLSVLKKAAK